MYNCEIFSIRKSKKDYTSFQIGFDYISTILRENDIDVRYKTDLSADASKLAAAVKESMNSESTDLFVFVNALNTSDSSSFKSLFYEFITQTEATLTPDHEHKGMTPKLKIFSLGDMGMGYKGYCFKLNNKLFVALPYASLAQTDAAELITKGVSRAQETVDSNFNDYPQGIAYFGKGQKSEAKKDSKGGKKKEGFFMSFIPHRGDTKSAKIRKIAVLIAIAVFIGALIYVINYFIIQPAQNRAINDEIRTLAYADPAQTPTTPEGEPVSEQNWDALKKINDEIVGWIRSDDSPIDYPVMFHEGDDQYSQYYSQTQSLKAS